jgi:hypothetical protein
LGVLNLRVSSKLTMAKSDSPQVQLPEAVTFDINRTSVYFCNHTNAGIVASKDACLKTITKIVLYASVVSIGRELEYLQVQSGLGFRCQDFL